MAAKTLFSCAAFIRAWDLIRAGRSDEINKALDVKDIAAKTRVIATGISYGRRLGLRPRYRGDFRWLSSVRVLPAGRRKRSWRSSMTQRKLDELEATGAI